MKRRLLLCLGLSLLLCGCQASFSESEYTRNEVKASNDKHSFPASYMIENKNNYFDYQPGLECSAFSSAYLLRHYGEDAKGLELFKTYPNKVADGTGVFPKGVVNFFEQKGYQASFVTDANVDTLKYEISKGAPVIVFIFVDVDSPSLHYTHYVPIIGYDETNFYFAESLDYKANHKDEKLPYNRSTDIETFKKLWVNIEGIWDNPYFQISK